MVDPTTPRPDALPVIAENIPHELRERRQWVGWRFEWQEPKGDKPGKWAKIPHNVRTGGNASSTDSTTWCSFDEALAAYRDRANDYDGIGYTLAPDDDVIGIDLDHVTDPRTGALGEWQEEQRGRRWAQSVPSPAEIIASVGSYAERSPSGKGARIFTTGKLWPDGRKQGGFEVYAQERYLTCTGWHIEGTPTRIVAANGALERLQAAFFTTVERKRTQSPPAAYDGDGPAPDKVLAKIRKSKSAAKFEALWAGNWQGANYPSQSEADAALCSMLAFWCGPDERLVDSMFRQSGLYREKWDTRRGDSSYGADTVRGAVENASNFYDWTRTKKRKRNRSRPGQ